MTSTQIPDSEAVHVSDLTIERCHFRENTSYHGAAALWIDAASSPIDVRDCIFADNGSFGFGAYAEYVCRPEDGPLVIKPAGISYEEAAPIPGGAGTALYFLRDKAKIQSGQTITVDGDAGYVIIPATE